jgi:DNA-binding transcriptional LysR family regulator
LFIARIVGPLADNMESQLLFDDPLYVVAAADNPWSRRRKVRLDDLMSEPWILPPLDTPLGAHVLEAFGMAGLNLPDAAVVSSIGIARIALVARGHFLTIAVRTCIQVLWPGYANQGSSDRPPGNFQADRDCHIEEPYPRAGGATFHRSRA